MAEQGEQVDDDGAVMPPPPEPSAEPSPKPSFMPSPGGGYDAAFRAEAVRQVRVLGERPTQVAAELGVSVRTLRRWVRAQTDAEAPQSGQVDAGADTAEMQAHIQAEVDHDMNADAKDDMNADVEGQPRRVAGGITPAADARPEQQPEAAPDAEREPEPAPDAEPEADPERRQETPPLSIVEQIEAEWPDGSDIDWPVPLPHLRVSPIEPPTRAALDFTPSTPTEPERRRRPRVPDPFEEVSLHPGDDIFPAVSRLVPAYRFPIILLVLGAAVALSRLVPTDYPLRPGVLALHVLSLVLSFGAVLVVDWHGLLWLSGRRVLSESTRLAAAAGPLIWAGLAGLIASGALLHPDLSSPLIVTKLVLVLAVAWNGAAMSVLRRRLAMLPTYCKPEDLPRRDWQLLMVATIVSQIGWWGAIAIGFLSVST